ncbi:MAG: DUF1641 domain-containing protein [Limnochordaceae bacterium]|nr:DUF1641 domain-containing protein [Limnochordaceae bacterium]
MLEKVEGSGTGGHRADGEPGQRPEAPAVALQERPVTTEPSQVTTRVMARLEALEASGALDTLVEAAGAFKALMDSMTPGVLARMAGLASDAGLLLDEVLQSGRPVLVDAVRALGDAARESRGRTRAPGIRELWQMARDPDTRRGLAFLLGLARALGARMRA